VKCILCGKELVTPKLRALLNWTSELGLTFAYREETCEDFEVEVWDPSLVDCARRDDEYVRTMEKLRDDASKQA
jgi:hypothetical protein